MTEGSFCEVCGDEGGATRMVLCENSDEGCLGGIHLYCCVPLRTELPTEAWYCSECQRARTRAAAAHGAAAAEAAAKRRKRREERRAEREECKRQRREERARLHKQQQEAEEKDLRQRQQQLQQQQQQLSTVPRPGAVARQTSGVAEVLAALTAGPSRPQQQQQQQKQQQQQGVASRDTLSQLLASLSKGEDKRQEGEQNQERERLARLVDGTTRRSQRNAADQAEQRQLAEQLSLQRCAAEGLCWNGQLPLPVAQQNATFAPWLRCYPIPGNPNCLAAARHSLVHLSAGAASQHPPTLHLLSCMDDLGVRLDRAHQDASMLLAPNLEQCMGHPAADARWRALWEMLAVNRQAVGLEVPRTDAPAAGACPGASVPLGKSSGSDGGTEGDGGGSSSSSLLLALVPNIFDPANMTMLGLLAAPLQREPRMPATAGHAAATRSILRRSGASVQQAEGAAAVAAAEPAVAAEVASLDAVVAEGEAADRLRRPLVWADSGSNDKQALELDIGSHYASPGRRAALAARPCRLPTIRSFEEVQAGSSSGGNSPKPLEGLRVALVGFGKQYELTRQVLADLQRMGASTYTGQVVLVDVLCIHPQVAFDGLERCMELSLGLAHLLATTSVRVYEDSSLQVLHEMIKMRRPLAGPEWLANERWWPVFPAGLMVVLDGSMLLRMPSAALARVLAEVGRLALASAGERGMWCVAAAHADVTALATAAAAGQVPARDNWPLWDAGRRASSCVRHLEADELGSNLPQPGEPAAPAVRNALQAARARRADCRLVYLCSEDGDTLRQAEERHTILAGDFGGLLEFLASR